MASVPLRYSRVGIRCEVDGDIASAWKPNSSTSVAEQDFAFALADKGVAVQLERIEQKEQNRSQQQPAEELSREYSPRSRSKKSILGKSRGRPRQGRCVVCAVHPLVNVSRRLSRSRETVGGVGVKHMSPVLWHDSEKSWAPPKDADANEVTPFCL